MSSTQGLKLSSQHQSDTTPKLKRNKDQKMHKSPSKSIKSRSEPMPEQYLKVIMINVSKITWLSIKTYRTKGNNSKKSY